MEPTGIRAPVGRASPRFLAFWAAFGVVAVGDVVTRRLAESLLALGLVAGGAPGKPD